MDRSLEHAQLMLAKAREDQQILDVLVREADAPLWGVGFHAQQAVEKALKAVLGSRSIQYSRTHDLTVLLEQLRDAGLELPDAALLPELNPFGVEHRYPGDASAELPAGLDRANLQGLVGRVLLWAETNCKSNG